MAVARNSGRYLQRWSHACTQHGGRLVPDLTWEVDMKRTLIATSGLAGLALVAAACGGTGGGYGAGSAPPSTGPTSRPSATATTLELGPSKLGPIVVDSEGRSLYLFGADTGGAPTCTTAGCAAEWPPFIANRSPQAGAGVAANQLGTTTRPDGRPQVVYNGHPLYYFVGDSQRGSTAGQGLNDHGGRWSVVHTDGTPMATY
jgi:predicted lipoprotein with Yx(FWY)xxD motif